MSRESDGPDEVTPDHWDPEPGRRVYVRSMESGDLGWIVRRGGEDKVRLDRPNQEIIREMNANWAFQHDHRPVSTAQIVQMIAYEADRGLLRLLGDHSKSRKNWGDLTDKQRVAWIEQGPSNPPIRRILYRTIMDSMTEHLR